MNLVPASRGRGGFTLLEVILTVAVLFVLLGLVALVGGYAQKSARRSRAGAALGRLQAALQEHMLEYGSYPTNGVDLASTAVTNWLPSRFSFADPWGHAYRYERKSPFVYTLYSTGCDGTNSADDIIAGED